MKAKQKRAQKKIDKDKRLQVISIQENDDSVMPLSVQINDKMILLLCEPHKFYKIQGVEKLIYKASEFKVDGVNGVEKTIVQKEQCVIQMGETQKTQQQIFDELMSVVKKQGNQNLKALKNVRHYFELVIPILVAPNNFNIQLSSAPWHDKIYEIITNTVKNPNKTRILVSGNKNTGKSTLCDFFVEQISKKQSICLLDLDVGKGRGLPGSISLFRYKSLTDIQTITYWIGEYTPLNYCTLYLNSMKKLLQIYQSKYFNDPLIVNTMGYLTGFGQLVLMQTYNTIQPSQFIFLNKSDDRKQFLSLKNQLLKSDIERRNILGVDEEVQKFKTNFNYIINQHAGIKGIQSKSKSFEQSLGITTLEQLLTLRLKQFKYSHILVQTKNGQILNKQFNPIYTDLQLLIFCDNENQNVYRLKGIGYGFNGKIFGQQHGKLCIKSQIAQFQKQFYNLNQKQIISLEQTFESELPYLLPNYKGLGTMGYRNLSSKKLRT